MKAKLFKAMGIVTVAIIMGYNVHLAQAEKSAMSDIMIENIEALSQNENSGGSSNSWDCWSKQKPGYGYWRCGSPCEWVDNFDGDGSSSKCFK